MCLHMVVCVCMCLFVYACVCLCMHVFVCVCMCLFVYACVCLCMHVFVCVCICLHHSTFKRCTHANKRRLPDKRTEAQLNVCLKLYTAPLPGVYEQEPYLESISRSPTWRSMSRSPTWSL